MITLTTMDDGWAVPLTNTSFGPSNTSHSQFLHDIGVWSKIAKHLWVWDCARRKHPPHISRARCLLSCSSNTEKLVRTTSSHANRLRGLLMRVVLAGRHNRL